MSIARRYAAALKRLGDHHLGPLEELARLLGTRAFYDKWRETEPQVQKLVALLFRHGNVRLLPKVIAAYRRLLNMMDGDITTAVPLDAATKRACTTKLEAFFRKRVHLRETVEPAILAGAILNIDNKMLDNSLRSQLKRMEYGLQVRGSDLDH